MLGEGKLKVESTRNTAVVPSRGGGTHVDQCGVFLARNLIENIRDFGRRDREVYEHFVEVVRRALVDLTFGEHRVLCTEKGCINRLCDFLLIGRVGVVFKSWLEGCLKADAAGASASRVVVGEREFEQCQFDFDAVAGRTAGELTDHRSAFDDGE